MRIINGTNRTLTVSCHKYQTVTVAPCFHEYVHPQQTIERGMGEDEVYIRVYAGEVPYAATGAVSKLLHDADGSRAYSNKTTVVITEAGRTIVDWNEVRRRYASDTARVALGPVDTAALNSALAHGQMLLAAVGLVLEEFGEKGGAANAVGIGVLAGAPLAVDLLKMLVQAFINQPPQTKPVDVDTLESVVRRITREELEKSDARVALSSGLLADEWLGNEMALIRSAPDGEPVSSDFLHHLEEWADGSNNLAHAVNLFNSAPNVSRWVLPGYIVTVGAYLHIVRLHDMIRLYNERKGRIPASEVEKYRHLVRSCYQGLRSANSAWNEYTRQVIADEHLTDTKQAWDLYALLTTTYHGVAWLGPAVPTEQQKLLQATGAWTDTSPMGIAFKHFEDVIALLDQDIANINAGRPPTHYWGDFSDALKPAQSASH